MHLGVVIVSMGPVCSGLLMIGAGCTCLRGEGCRSLARRLRAVKERVLSWSWSALPAHGMTPVAMRAGQDGAPDA
ncbi:hypothetical protein [Streptomyces sp. NPDC006333]|uniref:hypothetical protein n=1 Tax=unclassified Streptomyces TaxID=2593676 RepID=UPI0033AD8F9B